MKICLSSSSGGHYEQLLMLEGLKDTYEVFFVTEQTPYTKNKTNTYYFPQINRKEKSFILKFSKIFFQSFKIILREKPDIIISTGALSCIPLMLIGKLLNKKIIFIESFAKVNSPTLTGKLMYRFADVFIIQWETLRSFYPDAIYLGGIY